MSLRTGKFFKFSKRASLPLYPKTHTKEKYTKPRVDTPRGEQNVSSSPSTEQYNPSPEKDDPSPEKDDPSPQKDDPIVSSPAKDDSITTTTLAPIRTIKPPSKLKTPSKSKTVLPALNTARRHLSVVAKINAEKQEKYVNFL
jgi:hypothetical protein